jgi:hypothetical protein
MLNGTRDSWPLVVYANRHQFVFPNVSFTTSTLLIGRQLQSEGILWLASAMTILLVAAWVGVLIMHVKAVLQKEIMMPGMDEDKGKPVKSKPAF